MEYSKENFKAECDRRREHNLIVKGKTYDVKDMIKDLGGIWDSMQKQWLMPDVESTNACYKEMGVDSPLSSSDAPAAPTAAPTPPPSTGPTASFDPNETPF